MEAEKYIQDLIKEINSDNNYVSPTFEKYIDLIIKQYCIKVNAGNIYYRARTYTEEDRFDKWNNRDRLNCVFNGYDEKGSFVNLEDNSTEGRCNYRGEHLLYMASDITTAIQEVCSKPGIAISVAEIEIIETAQIVDFAKDIIITSGNTKSDYDIEFLNGFMAELVRAFNRSSIGEDEYVLTQYVCHHLKEKGIDGLQYISSYNRLGGNKQFELIQKGKGINAVLFNYEKAKARNSDLYLITDSLISFKLFKNDNKFKTQLDSDRRSKNG